jgi:hypothetical protein
LVVSNYETNFGISSAVGAGHTKIGFDESQPLAGFHQNQFL